MRYSFFTILALLLCSCFKDFKHENDSDIKMPEDHFINIKGNDELQTINIQRSDNLKQILAASVFNNNSIVYLSFYENCGKIKNVSIKQSGQYLLELEFNLNGSLKYKTDYLKDKPNYGIRKIYNENGDLIKTVTVSIKHGS